MILDLTRAEEAELLALAEQEGRTPKELVLEVIRARFLSCENDLEEQKILAERIADADRGDFLTEEEMKARFERMLHPR